ncbi:MAG: DMT family transporter [Firmicutes bacterium]|nr:DMT family transporter [Bacillota bacterium]
MNSKGKKYELLAVLGLLLAALFWGISYPLTKFVQEVPTFYIISVRFACAAAVLAICFFRHFRRFNFDTLKLSFILSFIVTAMYIFNIVGVKYTTSVRASFFTTLSFLVCPVINRALYKVRISGIIGRSALICLIGTCMLCYKPDMGGLVINPGDILCALASVCGAINIIYIEKMSHRADIDNTLFTIFLMTFISLWGTVIALFRGEFSYHSAITSSQMTAIIIMGLLCSAGAFILQIHSEKLVPSNRVGIIFSLEPASGCILSVLLIHETMSLIGWMGALVIMISIIYMELASSKEQAKLSDCEGDQNVR